MSTVNLSIVDRYPGVEIEGLDRAGLLVRESPTKIPIGRRNPDGISFPNAKIPGASAGCAVVGNQDGDWELHIWHADRPMVNGVRIVDADEMRLNDGDIIGIVQTGFTGEPTSLSGRLREFWRRITGKGSYVGVAARIRVGIKPDPDEQETAEMETDDGEEQETEQA